MHNAGDKNSLKQVDDKMMAVFSCLEFPSLNRVYSIMQFDNEWYIICVKGETKKYLIFTLHFSCSMCDIINEASLSTSQQTSSKCHVNESDLR